MKKELLKYAAFFLLAVSAVAFTACEKESDEDKDEAVSIVGVWTIQSVSIDVLIAGKTPYEYLLDLGLPADLAQETADEMMLDIEKMEDMTGTLELKEDGTYVAEFSNDDPDSDDNTGPWELSADGKTLTIDKGSDDEMMFEVLSLTKTSLNIKMVRVEEMEESTDTMEMTMAMYFTR